MNEFKWGPGDITDQGSGSEVFLSFADAVVGPDPFNGVDPGVGLGLYAVERDWFFWIASTDEAEFRQLDRRIMFITFPTGSGQENVNPPSTSTNLQILASPIGGDGSLQLTAHVRHVVSYE